MGNCTSHRYGNILFAIFGQIHCMKKILLYSFLFLLIVGGIAAWLVLGSGTAFSEKSQFFVIAEGQTDKSTVTNLLKKQEIIKNPSVFSALGSTMGIWEKIKPGKYEVKQGESLLGIARMLRANRQAQIKLVITKLRTKEDLAKLIGKNFSTDSAQAMDFMNSNDSLKQFNVDTNTVFTTVLPDTYSFYWNTSMNKIFQKLNDARNSFWSRNGRTEKAKALGYSPDQLYTFASIVEEETNAEEDRSKIASVYMNRIAKGMPLQADPTIKFAMKDFGLKRVYEKHLFYPSPYNTYRNKGLPPGPICTPSIKALEAVINTPRTDYLYFVANADLKGGSHFTSDYQEHLRYAKLYQDALTIFMEKKKQTAQ